MKIEPVSSINYDGGKVSAVRGYSKKEIRKKLEEYRESKDLLSAQEKQDKEYLSLFSNPDHLSFAELLERELRSKS